MSQSIPENIETNKIVVASLEKDFCDQFENAAFEKYKDSVVSYGLKLRLEARSAALQRDPNATLIEITTPDVVSATVRTEMKLVRLRQLRFPFRLLQQLITLVTGIVAKLTYDSANFQAGHPEASYTLWSIIFLLCIAITITLNYFEMKAELLR